MPQALEAGEITARLKSGLPLSRGTRSTVSSRHPPGSDAFGTSCDERSSPTSTASFPSNRSTT